MEVAVGNALAHVRFQLLPAALVGVHVRREAAVAAAGDFLGMIQRQIRALEQFRQGGHVAVGHGKPDAAGGVDQSRRAFDRAEDEGRQPLAEARESLRTGRAFPQQHELVAAQPVNLLARLAIALQALGNRFEHDVSGAVAQRVVDIFEPVQIEQQQCQRRGIAALATQDPFDVLAQRMTVAKPGQAVVVGGLAQLFGDGAFALDLPCQAVVPVAETDHQEGDRERNGNSRQTQRTRQERITGMICHIAKKNIIHDGRHRRDHRHCQTGDCISPECVWHIRIQHHAKYSCSGSHHARQVLTKSHRQFLKVNV